MPWKKFKTEGGFKVWKLNEQGEKVGNPLSDKPQTAEEADKQVAALYASEKKPKKEAEPITVTDDEAKEVKMMGYDEPMMMAVEMPGPLTFADLMAEEAAREAQMEMYELTGQFGRLSRNIMNSATEDKAGALVTLANEYAALVGKKVKEEIAEEKSQTIARQITGDNQPAGKSKPETSDDPGGDSGKEISTRDLFIWKEGDTYRWIAAYSNNRRDSDNPPEIISTESHKEFDEALQKGEWPMPELWPWHIPFPVGIATFHAYDVEKGFPIAGGYFYKGMEWAAEGMMRANWDGTSHGMPKEWIERSPDDPTIIIRHRTKEISPLPVRAAANKLAFSIISKESTMTEEKGLPSHKRDEFIAAFGEERVKQIEAALADKAKEADDAGIEKKEAEPTLTPDNPVVKALEMVITQLTTLDTRLKAIEDKQVEVEEKEQPFDLMEFLKSKSAIGQPTTKVDGRSKEAKDAPEEAKQESWTERASGIRVSLVDELVGANQEYYNSRR